MHTKVLASKLQVLEFMSERRIVWIYEIEQKFGYTYYSAKNRLRRLKKEGLVINMTRGSWELTEEGYRRLRYYKRKVGGASW